MTVAGWWAQVLLYETVMWSSSRWMYMLYDIYVHIHELLHHLLNNLYFWTFELTHKSGLNTEPVPPLRNNTQICPEISDAFYLHKLIIPLILHKSIQRKMLSLLIKSFGYICNNKTLLWAANNFYLLASNISNKENQDFQLVEYI